MGCIGRIHIGIQCAYIRYAFDQLIIYHQLVFIDSNMKIKSKFYGNFRFTYIVYVCNMYTAHRNTDLKRKKNFFFSRNPFSHAILLKYARRNFSSTDRGERERVNALAHLLIPFINCTP